MILLGAYAGLRVSEIASIRGEHVDLITHTIAITGKGDKTRYIPLHPVLQQLAADMPVRSWWFPSSVGNQRYLATDTTLTEPIRRAGGTCARNPSIRHAGLIRGLSVRRSSDRTIHGWWSTRRLGQESAALTNRTGYSS